MKKQLGVAPSGSTDTATKGYVDGLLGGTFQFTTTGSLAPGVGSVPIPMPRNGTLQRVRVAVGTAPTGQSIIVDVNKNGTSVYPTSTKPNVAADATTGGPFTPDTTSFVTGDLFTVDIDQVGSIVSGANLVVLLEYS